VQDQMVLEIQRSLNEITRGLGRVEGTLTEIKIDFVRHIEEDDNHFKDISKRLGSIEKKTYYGIGFIGAVSLAGGAILRKMGIIP
jgi:tetrahydromethanopterin S-methyltransferase subunit G